MGRIYQWLQLNPRHVYDGSGNEIKVILNPNLPKNWEDWKAVDFLRDPTAFGLFNKETLDVRRPVINDMADWSQAITDLNEQNAVANLPAKVLYGEIIYSKVDFGVLTLGAIEGYSVFHSLKSPTVSVQAATYILGAGNTVASFPGDGLIPQGNQHFTELQGFPAPGYPPAPAPATGQNTILRRIVTNIDVVHTGAPLQKNDLRAQLREIVPSWFP